MDVSLHRALVRTILEHAEDYPWTMQNIGLLALRLDDRRITGSTSGTPTAAWVTHPSTTTPSTSPPPSSPERSTTPATTEDPSGDEYHRERYSPPNDEIPGEPTPSASSGTPTTFGAGDPTTSRAHELHDSRQTPGTVTIIRWTFTRRIRS